MKLATPLADLTEKEWRRQVLQLADTLGWKSYFTFISKGSSHGFPDLVLARDRVVFLELKREKGKLTDQQKVWLRALLAAGQDAFVVRPRDLESLAAVLACRNPPTTILGRHAASDGLRAATLDEAA